MKIKIRGKQEKKNLQELADSGRLEKISKDQLGMLEKIVAALEDVDISIDQLTSFLADVDINFMQRQQRVMGRLPANAARTTRPQKAAVDRVDKEYVNEDRISVKFLQKMIQEELESIVFREGCGAAVAVPVETLPDVVDPIDLETSSDKKIIIRILKEADDNRPPGRARPPSVQGQGPQNIDLKKKIRLKKK